MFQQIREKLKSDGFVNFNYSPKDLFTFSHFDRLVQVQLFEEENTATISSYGMNSTEESEIVFKLTMFVPNVKTVSAIVDLATSEAQAHTALKQQES